MSRGEEVAYHALVGLALIRTSGENCLNMRCVARLSSVRQDRPGGAARVRLGGFLHSPFATPSGALASQGPSARCDAQRVELSDPPAVIAKYWCSRNIGASPTPSAMRSRSSPTGSESRQATWEGHLMWLINLLIAIAAWIAVCAAIIKLVEALP